MNHISTTAKSFQQRSIWKKIWQLVGPELLRCRWLVLSAYLNAMIAIVALILLPWSLKLIIDHVLSAQPLPQILIPIENFLHQQRLLINQTDEIIILALGYMLIAAIATLCSAQEKLINARVREQLVLHLRCKCFEHYQTLSSIQNPGFRSGDIVLRMTGDVYALIRFICRTIPQIFRHSIVALFTLGVMYFLEPLLALTGLLMVIILIVMVLYHGKILRQASRNKRKQEGHVAGFTQECVKGLFTIQTLTAEQHVLKQFQSVNRTSLRAGLRETSAAVNMECNMQMINGIAVATIIGISAAFVVNHQLTIGDLTVFVAYMVQLLKPVEKINELASAVSSGFSRAEMLFELFQQRPAVQDSPSATNVQLSRGLIEFKAVGFAYPGKAEDDSVLRDISFQLKPGQMTILSGASGSGKSTLINVLLKQLVPYTGVITLDGHNYSAMTTQSIRSRFAVLPQHHHLFSGRLSDSLWLNSTTIADSAIWEALAKVDMEAAIRQLPDGLNTVLTEDGLNFSGGQRARLCLARALLLERAVLVLDEPLANIDTQSQLIIVDALMQIRKTTTCLIVSHQPVLYQQADQLLTLEHGRLVNNTIQDVSRACANL